MVPDEVVATALLPTLADLPGYGWRALPADAHEGGGPADGELARLLAGRLAERDVLAMADSPVFVRPPARLAYATAAVLSGGGPGWEAFHLVSSEDFARTFAEAVAADVVTEPGGAELLGSASPRVVEAGTALAPEIDAQARRTTFGGATTEGMVAVHVDLVVLRRGPRLVMLWLADAPDPFPDGDRAHLVARLAGRLVADPAI